MLGNVNKEDSASIGKEKERKGKEKEEALSIYLSMAGSSSLLTFAGTYAFSLFLSVF
jgi:hypothetical protein